MTARMELDDYVGGVLRGDRTVLGRAITLVESTKPEHQQLAQQMLLELLPHSGKAHRIGITGVPGAGKSTFIDAFGSNLTAQGHRVAVLAVDPTSPRSGGSILGDRTRMHRLSVDSAAFIRPSPAGGTLGGVTRSTREAIVVVEAAGYDVVLVETVGVGQSETIVANMVDFFLVLMIAGAGDELQGIKKGIVEMADMIAVNKADGDGAARAKAAAAEYRAALHILAPASPTWSPPVITISGLANVGLDELWRKIVEHRERMTATGELQQKRRAQEVKWMWAMVEDRLHARLHADPQVRKRVPELEAEVAAGTLAATVAADEIASMLGL